MWPKSSTLTWSDSDIETDSKLVQTMAIKVCQDSAGDRNGARCWY